MSDSAAIPDVSPLGRLRRLYPPRGRALAWAVSGVGWFVALLVAWRLQASWPVPTTLVLLPLAVGTVIVWARGGPQLLGPLFVYDLARLARRGRTTMLRCLYALLLLGLLALLAGDRFPYYLTHPFAQSVSIRAWALLAKDYTLAILVLQAGAVLILAPAYLAGAFTEEKERGTIDLLFTTDLRDRELVLGKLFGRLVHLSIILLTTLPVLCLTALWGGVGPDILIAGFVTTALGLLSVGSISLLCSVLSRTVLASVISSYAAVFLLNAVCAAAPLTSPVLFVPALDFRVEQELQAWEDQWSPSATPISGPRIRGLAPFKFAPRPEPLLILLEMLAWYVPAQLIIFATCTGTAILLVRESCLARGDTVFRGIPDRPATPKVIDVPVRTLDDERPDLLASLYEPVPVREPALLWKEMYQGPTAFPGPDLGEWLWPRGKVIAALLVLGVGLSLALGRVAPEGWTSVVNGINLVGRVVTVLLMSAWCLLVAFRVAGSVSRERDRRTLESLFALPGERMEILFAKWKGSVLRYRMLGYGLAITWAVGLATGALHPAAALLLAAVCTANLAFLSALGVWLSLLARNTLWANMTMALILLLWFGGVGLEQVAQLLSHDIRFQGWRADLVQMLFNPGRTWWTAGFAWADFREALTQGTDLNRACTLAAASVPVCAAAAWLIWVSCRRRFRVTPARAAA